VPHEHFRSFWEGVRDFSAPISLGLTVVISTTWGMAQNTDPVPTSVLNLPSTLIADQIYFDQDSQYYRAIGSVQIFYDGVELRAPSLSYDVVSDRVLVDGPLYIIDSAGGQVVYGEFADMSSDLQDGVIIAARQLVDETMQVASQEMIRREGRYTEFPYVRASSCEVCSENATPLWELRARRAVHDQETRSITYRHAQLRVAGTPVLYTPWLRTPDPSVQRANGFLPPVYSVNSRLGSRVGLPYFYMLGDSADITMTPQISLAGGSDAGDGVLRTLESRYRQSFLNGYIELNGALSRDALTDEDLRVFLFSNGRFEFDNEIDLVFQTQSASDRAYIATYDFFADGSSTFAGDDIRFAQDRLSNFLRFSRSNDDELLSFDLSGFAALREPNYDYKSPNRLLDAQWTFFRETGDIGGLTLNFGAQAEYNEFGAINPRRRDVDRAMANFIWSGGLDAGEILRIDTDLALFLDRYGIHDDAVFSDVQTSTAGLAATRMSWPLQFEGPYGGVQNFTPSIGIMTYDAGRVSMPSLDGSIDNIDAFNHANLARFRRINRSQNDQYDVTVADVDLTYRYAAANGFYFGGSFERDQILSGGNPNLQSGELYTLRFGQMKGDLQLSATSRFNPDFARVSDVFTVTQALEHVTLEGSYTRIEPDEALGNQTAELRYDLGLTAQITQEVQATIGIAHDRYAADRSFVTGRIAFDNTTDWRSSLGWTYDSDDNDFDDLVFDIGHKLDWGGEVFAIYGRENDTLKRVGVGLAFDNECLRMSTYVSRVENRVASLTPITQLSLNFEIGSFGAGSGTQTRKCM